MTIKTHPFSEAPLPWQQPLWEQLTQAYENKRLPHAVLLTDRQGFAPSDFAKAFARYILCHNQTNQQAHLFDLGHHPDFFHIAPIEESTIITIDTVRALKNNLLKSGHAGVARIVILEPAHALNNAASNALLKLLEEPNAGIFFILVSEKPSQLSKTLLSRCQRFSFNADNSNLSLDWLIQQNMKAASAAYFLKLAEGAPLTALKFSTTDSQQFRKEFLIDLHNLILSAVSPITLAEKWAKKEKLEILLEWICRWLLDLARLHQGVLKEAEVPSPYLAILHKWHKKLSLDKIFAVVEKIYEIRRLSHEIKSLNAQNNVETVLILLQAPETARIHNYE